MKTTTKFSLELLLLCTLVYFSSCEKFLNEKQDKKIVIPETLNDLQALLDAAIYINYGSYPSLLELATDDYYVSPDVFNSASVFERDNYMWNDYPLYLSFELSASWMSPYRNAMIMNTVLGELPEIKSSDQRRKDEIKGAALFYRAYVFYQLAQVYCEAYDPWGDNSGLGIAIRLSSDFNQQTVRASVKETYEQIIADLTEALELLPDQVIVPTRPSKTSALSSLAKVYLAMGDYQKALNYSESALEKFNTLMDFNTLNPAANITFTRFNAETIYFAFSTGSPILNPNRARVAPDLIESYQPNDLRKTLFFKDVGNGEYSFKGSYGGTTNNTFFVGMTTSELYLIQAECLAREGKPTLAIESLNHLLVSRYQTGTFIPYEAIAGDELLQLILQERRKELVLRGVRWSDLKRLNKEGRFTKTLERRIGVNQAEEVVTLPPNDPRYNFLIPDDVILKTGIIQNPRNK
jgi:tetratricopeptide (TPR) repeat protein